MKSFLVLLCCLVLFAVPRAFPWGAEGHEAIAETAQGLLSQAPRAKIEAILGGPNRLPSVATWLDDARNALKHNVGPLKNDPEARQFNTAFPENEQWHYVNLPVGLTQYADPGPFATQNDIVHGIAHGIDVLEGRATDLTPLQAVRLLVHLVGDAHQPMHTITGFYDLHDPAHARLITDPAETAGHPEDRGGNQLFYTKSLELHAYWDKKMPQKVQRASPAETLAHQLAAESTVQKWATPGDYHEWAAKWVGDSAAEGGKAYEGIQFGASTLNEDKTLARIEIVLPDGYEEAQTARAKIQLVKGACHLAQLLNAIRYK